MVVTLRSLSAVAKCLKAPVLENLRPGVQLSIWPSLLSNQYYIESSILIFFSITTKSLLIFFV